LSDLSPQDALQVVHIQHAVFDDQSANVGLEGEIRQFLDQLVLLTLLEKPVQVDNQLCQTAVVG